MPIGEVREAYFDLGAADDRTEGISQAALLDLSRNTAQRFETPIEG